MKKKEMQIIFGRYFRITLKKCSNDALNYVWHVPVQRRMSIICIANLHNEERGMSIQCPCWRELFARIMSLSSEADRYFKYLILHCQGLATKCESDLTNTFPFCVWLRYVHAVVFPNH